MSTNFLENILVHSKIGYARCKPIYKDLAIEDIFVLKTNSVFCELFDIKKQKEFFVVKDALFNSKNVVSAKNIYKTIVNILKKGVDTTFEFYLREKNLTIAIEIIFEDNEEFTLIINKSNIIDKVLFERQGYFKSIINNMSDLLIIMDLDFNITYVSPSVRNILGFKESQVIGKHLEEVIEINKAEEMYSIYKNALKRDSDYEATYDIIQYNQKEEPIKMEYLVKFLRNSSKQIEGIVALGRDITEWSKNKEELARSRERLALLLNSTAEGIFGIDMNGFIRFANKSCIRILGYNDYFDLIQRPVKAVFGADYDRDVFVNRFSKVFNEARGVYNEVEQFLRADGSSFYAEFFIHPQIVNHVVVGAVVTFFDISNIVKTQDELMESERSKSVLLANLPGLAYHCDFDDQYTFRFVSQGCYDLTGYLPENFINNKDISFGEIILPKYQEYVRNEIAKAVENNSVFKLEYEITAQDGTVKWVFEQGQPIIDEKTKEVTLEGIIIDISEQKHKQQEIEYLSYYDSLTKIKNRASFEMAKDELYKEEYLPVSQIVGDINGLKLINDAFGHAAGDRILAQAGGLLDTIIGDRGLVFRTSGDEFSILLPNTTNSEAYQILLEINEKIKVYNEGIKNDFLNINFALGFATMDNLDTTFEDLARVAENYMYMRKLNESLSSHSVLISHMKTTLNEKSQITEEHAERMTVLTRMIGKALKLTQVELDELALIATLHDIGKIGVDDRILQKPGPLTEDEWIEMRRHPEIGYRICAASPELVSIASYILSHHERWDGMGYPSGLKGEAIPLLSRITSIVDAFDAMTGDRPYREKMSVEEALKEIEANAGTQFDPTIAMLFIKLMKKNKTT